jgi:hypothetical protein
MHALSEMIFSVLVFHRGKNGILHGKNEQPAPTFSHRWNKFFKRSLTDVIKSMEQYFLGNLN